MSSKISFPAILFLFFILSQQILKSQSYEELTNEKVVNLVFNTTQRVIDNEEAYCQNSFVSSSQFISLGEIGFEPGLLKVPALYMLQNMPSDLSEGETEVALRSGPKKFKFAPYVVVSLKSPYHEMAIQSFTVTNVFTVFTIGACTLIKAANDLLNYDNSNYSDLKLHLKTVASSKNFIASYSVKAVFSNTNTINLWNSIPKERKCFASKDPNNSDGGLSDCLSPVLKYVFLDEQERLSCSIHKPNKAHQQILSLDDESNKFSLFSNYYAYSILQILNDSSKPSLIGSVRVRPNGLVSFRDNSNKAKIFFSLNSNILNSGVLKVCAKFNVKQYSSSLGHIFVKIIAYSNKGNFLTLNSTDKEMLDDTKSDTQLSTTTLCASFSVCDLSEFVKDAYHQDVTYEFLIQRSINPLPVDNLVSIYTAFSRVTINLDKQENYPIFIPGTLCTIFECYSSRGSNFKRIRVPDNIVRYRNTIKCIPPIDSAYIEAEGFQLQKLPERLTKKSVVELCGSTENAAKHNGNTGILFQMQPLKSPIKNNSIVRLPSTVTTSEDSLDCDIRNLDNDGAVCVKKMKRHMIDIIVCFLNHNELLKNNSTVSEQLSFSRSYFQCLDEAENGTPQNLHSNLKSNTLFLSKFIDKIEKGTSYSGQSVTNADTARVGSDLSTSSKYIQSASVDNKSSENYSSIINDLTIKLNEKSKNLTTMLKKVESCEANFTTVYTERILCNELLNNTVKKLNTCNTNLQKRKGTNSCKGKLTRMEEELQNCRSDVQLKDNKLKTCDKNYKNATANHECCEGLLNETKKDFANSKEVLNATIISLRKCERERNVTSDTVTECQKNLNRASNNNKTCNMRNKNLSNKFEECRVSLTHCEQNNTLLLSEVGRIKDDYINVDNERENLKLEMKQLNEKINELLLIHGISSSGNATLSSKLEKLIQSSREGERVLQEKTSELIQSKNEIEKISAALTTARENVKKNSEDCKVRLSISKKLKATEKEVKELTASLEAMQETKKSISGQIQTSEGDIQHLRADLENVKQAKINITSQVKSNEDEVEKLLARLQAVKKNNTNIMTQVETGEEETDILLARLQAVNQNNTNIMTEVVTSEGETERLLANMKAIKNNNRNITSQVEMGEEERENLLAKLQNIEEINKNISTQLTTAEHAMKQLTSNLQSIEEAKINISSQVKTSKDEVEKLLAELQSMQQNNMNITSQVEMSEDEAERLLAKLQAVKQNKTSIMIQVETSEDEAEKLLAKLQAVNQNSTNIMMEVEASEDKTEKLLDKLQAIKNNNTKITGQVEMSEEENRNLLAKLQNIEENNTNISTQITTAEHAMKQLTANLESIEEAKMNISSQVKTNKNEVEKLLARLKAIQQNNTNITSQVETSEDEAERLLAKLQAVKQNKTSIMIQVETSEDEAEKLLARLKALNQNSTNIMMDVETSENETEKLLAKLQDIKSNNTNITSQVEMSEQETRNLLAKLQNIKENNTNISTQITTAEHVRKQLTGSLESIEEVKMGILSQVRTNEDEVEKLLAKLEDIKENNMNISTQINTAEHVRKQLMGSLESIEEVKMGILSQVRTNEDEAEKLLAKLQALKEHNMNIMSEVETSENEAERLLVKLQGVKQNNTNIMVQVETNEDEAEKLLARLKAAKQKKTNVMLQTKVCEETLKQLTVDLQNVEEAKLNISNELEEWKRNNERLTTSLLGFNQSNQKLYGYLKASEDKNKELQAKLTVAEESKQNISNELTDWKKQNDKLSVDLQNVEEAKNNIATILKASEDRNKDLLAKLTVAEESKQNISNELIDWKKQNDKLSADLQDAEEAKKNIATNLKASEDRNKDLLAKLTVAEQSKQTISNELTDWKKLNDKLSANLLNIDEAKNNISTNLKASEDTNKFLLAKLAAAEESKQNISNELEEWKRLNNELSANLLTVEQAKNNVSTNLKASEDTNKFLLGRLAAAEQLKQNISSELEEWKRLNNELSANLLTVEQAKNNASSYLKTSDNRNKELLADLKNVEEAKLNISNELEEWKRKNERLTASVLNLNKTNKEISENLEEINKYFVKFVCENFDGWKSQEEYNECLSQNPLEYSKALKQTISPRDGGLLANGKYYPKGLLCHDVCSSFTSPNSNVITKTTGNDTLCVQDLRKCYDARDTCVMKMFQQQVKLQSYIDSNDTNDSEDFTCDPIYNMHTELLKFLHKHMNLISSCILDQYNDTHEFPLHPIKYVRSISSSVRHPVGSRKQNPATLSAPLSKRINDDKSGNGNVIFSDKKQFVQDLSVLNVLLTKLLREHTLTNSNSQNTQVSTNIHLNHNMQSGNSHTSNVNMSALVNLKYDANKSLQKTPSSWCTEEGKKNPRVSKAIELFKILPENYNFLRNNVAVLSRLFDSEDLEKAVHQLNNPQVSAANNKETIKPDPFTSPTRSSFKEKENSTHPLVTELKKANTQSLNTQLNTNETKAEHLNNTKILQPYSQNNQTTNQLLTAPLKPEDIIRDKKTNLGSKSIQLTMNKTSQDMHANVTKQIPMLQEPSTATESLEIVGNVVNKSLNEKENPKVSESENASSRATNVNNLALVATGSLFVVGAVSALSWYLWSKKDRTTQDALGLQASESMYDWDDQLDDISALQ